MLCCIFCNKTAFNFFFYFWMEAHYGTSGETFGCPENRQSSIFNPFFFFFSFFSFTCALSLGISRALSPPGSLGQINAIKLLMIMLHVRAPVFFLCMPYGELKCGRKTCYMNAWLYSLSKENKIYDPFTLDSHWFL